MADGAAPSALDRPAARVVALLIAALAAAALGWINREAFVSAQPDQAATASSPQLSACLSERISAVDRMREEGVIDARQYDTFRARAEAFCTARFPSQ